MSKETDILSSIFGQPEIPKGKIDLTLEEQAIGLMKRFAEMNKERITPGTLLKEVSFTGLMNEESKNRPLMFIRYIEPHEPWLDMGQLVNIFSLIRVDKFDCVCMYIGMHGDTIHISHNSALLVPYND